MKFESIEISGMKDENPVMFLMNPLKDLSESSHNSHSYPLSTLIGLVSGFLSHLFTILIRILVGLSSALRQDSRETLGRIHISIIAGFLSKLCQDSLQNFLRILIQILRQPECTYSKITFCVM